MKKKLKGLFITHNYGLYGASQSLQLLLRNTSDIDITLFIPFREILTKRKKRKIASLFGLKHSQIKQCFLPWDNCFEGSRTDIVNATIKKIENLFWKLSRKWFYSTIERNDYDFIHLNSIVLNEIINERFRFVIHIRELLIKPHTFFFERMKRAKGVIFIDKSVALPFRQCRLQNPTIIGNPVDMRKVGEYMDLYGSETENVVLSLIGRIEAAKGIDFIIRTFKRVNNNRLRLIVVGDSNLTQYKSLCRKLAHDDSRIQFWGEEKNIWKIYAMSDYIIRGEGEFRIGRTILEALYSDCTVIAPSRKDKQYVLDKELDGFHDRLLFYSPRNTDSLCRILGDISGIKVRKHKYQTNIHECADRFMKYITNHLTNGRLSLS